MRTVHLHLVFLALASWLVAAILSSILEAGLQAAPTLSKAAPKRRVAAERPPLLAAPRLATLLGLPRRDSLAELPAAKPSTPSPLILLGTLEPTFAAVFDPLDARVHTVSPGDVLHDDEVLSISHTSIRLSRNGETLELRLDKAARGPPSPARPTASFTHAELTGALNNPQELIKQIQLLPDFKDGRFTGFKVLRLQEGSLLARAGLAKGDTIRRLNGLDLTAPESMSRLLASAQSVTQVDVDLDRDGQALHWSVSLTP